MDIDISKYLDALQASQIANEKISFDKVSQEEQKQEPEQSIGGILTTEGILGAGKMLFKQGAKMLGEQALQKIGVDAGTASKVVSGDLQGVVNETVSKVGSAVEQVQQQITSGLSDDLNTAKSAVSTATGAVNDLSSTANNIASELGNAGEGLLEKVSLSNAQELLQSRVANSEFEDMNDLMQAPRTLSNTIATNETLPEAPSNLGESGTEMIDMSGKAVPDMTEAEQAIGLENINAEASGVASNAEAAVGAISSNVDNATSAIGSGLASGVEAVSNAVSSATGAIASTGETLATTATSLASTGEALATGLAATGEAVAGAATGALAGLSLGSVLGPIGIVAGLIGGIVSLVEGTKKHEMNPVLSPSSQFL